MITLEQVQAAIRKVATDNPYATNPTDDFDLGGCLYNGPDGSHCIAGAAMIELGWDISTWPEHEAITFVLESLRIPVEPEGVSLLHRAQVLADEDEAGDTWGKVLHKLTMEGML